MKQKAPKPRGGRVVKYPYTKLMTTNGVVTLNQDLSHDFGFISDSIEYGPNLADWRVRIKEGRDCTTSADGQVRSIKKVPAELTCSYNQFGVNYSETYKGFMGNDLSPTSTLSYNEDVYQLALTRFISKARAVQHRFQGGVFLGELRETIHLLRRPYRIFREVTKLYHSKCKQALTWKNRAGNFRRRLGSGYLEYVFGVQPLIHDIDDLLQDMARYSAGRQPHEFVKSHAVGRRVETLIENQAQSPVSFWTDVRHNRSSIYDDDVVIRGSVKCMVPEVKAPDKSSLMVALSDFVPTVYELIPFSFLLDYFVNVGDMISALTFLESSVEWACATKRQVHVSEMRTVYTLGYTPIEFSNVTNSDVAHAKQRIVYFKRFPVVQFVPALSFTLPGLGSKRWLNMGALLAQCRKI